MIVGVGVDVCAVQRWAAMAARRPGLVRRLLTEAEAATPPESQAARFAAKEALAKALGGPSGVSWLDVEVVSAGSGGVNGPPRLVLRGTAAAAAAQRGVTRTHLSLSHDGGVAVAFVVCEGRDPA
ncbi:MAG: holo-ACP synthase [Propionibacteriaceae bacterium]|jgi:holo-[acyl-carrier protein] synthase|nr:holo-ACP synthase [Propionibacteriaceae bacterium]